MSRKEGVKNGFIRCDPQKATAIATIYGPNYRTSCKKEIDKSKRYYELQYGQPLSEQEEIEIKKGIVLRLGFFVFIPLLILFLTLMERGMSG